MSRLPLVVVTAVLWGSVVTWAVFHVQSLERYRAPPGSMTASYETRLYGWPVCFRANQTWQGQNLKLHPAARALDFAVGGALVLASVGAPLLLGSTAHFTLRGMSAFTVAVGFGALAMSQSGFFDDDWSFADMASVVVVGAAIACLLLVTFCGVEAAWRSYWHWFDGRRSR